MDKRGKALIIFGILIILVLLFGIFIAAGSLDDNIISYYKLDESSGDVIDAHDDNDGTPVGVTYEATGVINTAYNFDGADYVTMGDNADFENDNFSVSFWTKRASTGAYLGLFSLQMQIAGIDGICGVLVRFTDDDTLSVATAIDSTFEQVITDETFTDTDVWNHFVFTKSGTSVKIYHNGSEIESGSISSSTVDYSTTTWKRTGIGVLYGSGTGWIQKYNGTLDEVGIWDRALEPSEVTALYNNGNGFAYPFVDTTKPTWKDNKTDASNSTKNGDTVYFNITLEDNEAEGYYIFSFDDGTGSFVNGTLISWTTPEEMQVIRNITAIKNQEVRWKWYFNDSAGNNNETPIWSFIVSNSLPTHTTPILTTPSGKNFSYENLTCFNQSTYDADNDEVINIFNWYKNSEPFTIFNMPFEGGSNSTWTRDYSDYSNNGNVVNAIWNSLGGVIGGSYEFDGDEDYIKIADDDNLDLLTHDLSISAWINYKQTGESEFIVGKRSSGWQDGYGFYISSSGDIKCVMYNNTWLISASAPYIGSDWTLVTCVMDRDDRIYIYQNGVLTGNSSSLAGTNWETEDLNSPQSLMIGVMSDIAKINDFNGSIDEVKIYNHALTPEQITNNHLLNYNTIVSEQTEGGDNYMCQITPNDGEADGNTLNSSSLEVYWAITFNVTSGEDGNPETNFNIDCNNGLSVTLVDSPFTAGFEPGSHVCVFTRTSRFDKTIIFTADNDKPVNLTLSTSGFLSIEEHTWLEAIYNCLYSGDCSLYNLLLEVNQTVSNIWEHTAPTDKSVVLFENITNKVVDSTHNLTIDYSVYIPIKAGYNLGAYLPIRIGYWFLDTTNTTCYNQGDKPTGVEDPYCQPLIIETLGPMGGSVNFTVKLHPSLPAGGYSIKQIIDIDPNNVWINYGQETIGTFLVTENLTESGISLETTGESNPNINQQINSQESSSSSSESTTTIIKEKEIIIQDSKEDKEEDELDEDEIIYLNNPGITGGVIGTGLFSGWMFVVILGIFAGLFVVFIICQTIIKLKKK